jgi:hypothetical protein
MAEQPERPSILDEIADLLQMASDWVRQEAGSVMKQKVILPLQGVALMASAAQAAAALLVIGLIFVEVGMVMLMGEWLTYPVAFLVIGGVTLLGSLTFLVIRFKLVQR